MANTKSENNKTENLYMQLNTSELTAIIMKGSPHSNDRDAGFCSGSSEGGDDFSIDHSRLDPSSPTDASEDSVEVKVSPIALVRNKRKSTEPSKVVCNREETTTTAVAPLKKRIRYTSTTDSAVVLTPPAAATPPPQPWDASQVLPHELMPNPAHVYVRHPGVTTLHRAPINDMAEQQEPLALVLKKPTQNNNNNNTNSNNNNNNNNNSNSNSNNNVETQKTQECTVSGTAGSPTKTYITKKMQRVLAESEKFQGTLETATTALQARIAQRSAIAATVANASAHNVTNLTTGNTPNATAASVAATVNGRPQQRNYKNMTRERRIEANARERTRVHTISAAYETLRRAVPSYSNTQKLSKLSVLRVACSYILTLSRMAGYDYSEDQSAPSISSCFDAVTATIQTEGKIRKKKDE
ncbi:rhoGEF domain-containing protein gxcI [Teleopsis dalmanni]|uniref:rhoGEF domain-containing protein gxcI n=1 Tax=Teleopsis dalmanni TaxID=139649 RepID=UPI0018CC959D|nr:rhoGEF domain-containing protein gxcI [Teleopsis dalmanni]